MSDIIRYILFITAFGYLNRFSKGLLCGTLKVNSMTEKIIGGYDVGYYKYSWFAVLISNSEIICGATLIGSKTVLTAAHCFKPHFKHIINGNVKIEDIYTVKLGVYNNCKKEITQKHFQCTKIHIHESYFEEMPYFDIAVIILKEETSEFIPICLPDKVFRSKEGTVQGFGRLYSNNDTVPCALQEARLLVHSDARCKSVLESQDYNSSEFQHAFCAGYLDGKIDTCLGDSGGPFVIVNEKGYYVQLGITSFGFGCASKNSLGIYTDISHFIDWISEKSNIDDEKESISESNDIFSISNKRTKEFNLQSTHDVSIAISPRKVVGPFRYRRKKKVKNIFKSNLQVNVSSNLKIKRN